MSFLVTNYHNSWRPLFKTLDEQLSIVDRNLTERASGGEVIFPAPEDIFRAFSLTPLEKVKVVIVGQDPYHGEGEAQGFSFSVPDDIKRPPSLRNIFKELHSDIGCEIPETNDLTPWATQGVLLLNASLTVAKDSAASHKKVGWETFTDSVISCISQNCIAVVFILWGKFAESKAVLIDDEKHRVHISAHPSPLSARRGFFGSQPFSKANSFLQHHKRGEISWELK